MNVVILTVLFTLLLGQVHESVFLTLLYGSSRTFSEDALD